MKKPWSNSVPKERRWGSSGVQEKGTEGGPDEERGTGADGGRLVYVVHLSGINLDRMFEFKRRMSLPNGNEREGSGRVVLVGSAGGVS